MWILSFEINYLPVKVSHKHRYFFTFMLKTALKSITRIFSYTSGDSVNISVNFYLLSFHFLNKKGIFSTHPINPFIHKLVLFRYTRIACADKKTIQIWTALCEFGAKQKIGIGLDAQTHLATTCPQKYQESCRTQTTFPELLRRHLMGVVYSQFFYLDMVNWVGISC